MRSVSLALMYGPAFPILYPITMIVMMSEYIRERYMLCYYYREPTTYDQKMQELSLKMMNTFAIIPLAFSFWQLGNRQFFENFVLPVDTINSVSQSGHFLIQNILSVRLGDPRLLSGLGVLFVVVIMIKKLTYKDRQKTRNFDEELVPY